MAEKIYNISSIKSVRGDPETLSSVITGDPIDIIDLSSLTIDKINDGLFGNIQSKKVILPETVKSIGMYCFSEGLLEEIDLKNTEILCDYSFHQAKKLKSLSGNKLKVIGNYSFNNVYSISNFNLDFSNLKYMISGPQLFYEHIIDHTKVPVLEFAGNYVLQNSDYIPETVDYLGKNNYNISNSLLGDNNLIYRGTINNPYAWAVGYKSSKPTGDVVLNENTIGLCEEAIKSTTLTSLKLPESLKYFSGQFCYGCTIPKIIVPSLDWWFSRDFDGYNNYTIKCLNGEIVPGKPLYLSRSNTLKNTYQLYDYDGNQLDTITEVELPETAGNQCLSSFTNLQKLTVNIPDSFSVPGLGSVGNIGRFFSATSRNGYYSNYVSFWNCFQGFAGKGMNNVNSDNLKVFENDVNAVNSISNMYIPNSLTELTIKSKVLAPYMIPSIKNITKLTLDVEKINKIPVNDQLILSDFASSSGSFELIFKNLTEIGDGIKVNPTYLTSLKIENSPVSKLPGYCFYNSKNLKNVELSKNITTIDEYSFSGCQKLENITFEENSLLETIRPYAFQSCSALKNFSIPDSVTEIAGGAFSGCSSLIQTEDNVSYVDKWIIDCSSSVTTVSLRDNTTGIAENAFYACQRLTSITLPDSVKFINTLAFGTCTLLESINIPNNVINIGTNAFKNCQALKNVTIGNGLKRIGSNLFHNCPSLTDLTFLGTIEQWNAIEKDINWNTGSSISTIHCSDGDVTI